MLLIAELRAQNSKIGHHHIVQGCEVSANLCYVPCCDLREVEPRFLAINIVVSAAVQRPGGVRKWRHMSRCVLPPLYEAVYASVATAAARCRMAVWARSCVEFGKRAFYW